MSSSVRRRMDQVGGLKRKKGAPNRDVEGTSLIAEKRALQQPRGRVVLGRGQAGTIMASRHAQRVK